MQTTRPTLPPGGSSAASVTSTSGMTMSDIAGPVETRQRPRSSLASMWDAGTCRSAARALGWISLGIGVAEIAFPKALAKLMGVQGPASERLLRIAGIREIAQGVDILSHDDPTTGVWARLTGDVMDGALLGVAASKTRNTAGLLAVCGMVLPVVIADALVAARLSAEDQQR